MSAWILVAQGHYPLERKLIPGATELWRDFVSGTPRIGRIGLGDEAFIFQAGTGSVALWGRAVVDEVRADGTLVRYTERFLRPLAVPENARRLYPTLAAHKWQDGRVPIFLALHPDNRGRYVPGHMTGVAFRLSVEDSEILLDTTRGFRFPIVFARIGWMERYDGPSLSGSGPIGGGSYNKRDIGNEVFTFQPLDGRLYGYVQVPGGGDTIDLSRITGAQSLKASASGVAVVWFAGKPEGGQAVIGWYLGAEVFEKPQSYPSGSGRELYQYVCRTDPSNAVLLPPESRTLVIPSRGAGLGRSNIVYVLDESGRSRLRDPTFEWMARAAELIRTAPAQVPARDAPVSRGHPRGGQGFAIDSAERDIIDAYAMRMATARFEREGYTVHDEHKNHPYDLRCVKGESTLFAEVKGTKTMGRSVLVTAGEIEFARAHPKESVLVVCHSILLDSTRKPFGGKVEAESPWKPDPNQLTPTGYSYSRSGASAAESYIAPRAP